jgi:NADH-quinone oxidoreductase subunit C
MSKKLEGLINQKLSSLVATSLELGDLVVRVQREKLLDLCKLIKYDTELQFDMLVDVTAVDWLDREGKKERFEIVYHFLSIPKKYRMRLKAWVPESDPTIDSLVPLWSSANFSEREVWDMYGIRFRNHPDLRRILMYDEFEGHPLRKDYPVQGKQPRVSMLHPEVENTARDMLRPALVQIKKKSGVNAHP